VIYFTGFLPIDPLLGMAFGVVLLLASWGIIRDSLSILMESSPEGINLIKVAEALDKLPGVTGVHHMHAWTLTSNKNVFSAHLRIDKPNRAAALLAEAHDLLRLGSASIFPRFRSRRSALTKTTARTWTSPRCCGCRSRLEPLGDETRGWHVRRL
jgi:cobalt-zinc-cadmium efflux system protein